MAGLTIKITVELAYHLPYISTRLCYPDDALIERNIFFLLRDVALIYLSYTGRN